VERDKALDMALGQIEKQFGKGAIMRMGEESKIKIASIPTGALSLDLALGIGGLPRGRVVEIYGPEGSGKCMTEGTQVWTDSGLETIGELFARAGQPASCTSRITDITDLGVRAVNERGELESVAALTHNNLRPVRRLTLKSGRTVEATHNHPLRVLSDGWIGWKEVGDIVEGDVVVSALFGANESIGASALTEDEAVLLGYLIAEGGLGEAAPERFCFTNAHDPDVVDEVKRLCRDLLDVEPKQYGIDYHFNSKQARETLRDEYGLEYGKSAEKVIPYCVRTAGPKVQAAFLSALYEGDGWIEKGPEIGYCTASDTLAEQLQLMLYGLGIPATRCTKWNPTYERDYYTVLIGPAGVRRFLDTIGFRSARRAEQVARHAEQITQRSSHAENIPGLWPLLDTLRKMIGGDREFDRLAGDLRRRGHTDCSRQRLRGIVAWAETRVGTNPSARGLVDHLKHLAASPYTYEAVTLVEDAGEQPTFDLMLPNTHSFIANGVLSHNTTVALHAIAEAQKAGGIAAFIDAEHALDPNYAAALGVDVEALLVSQPDTGEQALEITDMLVRSGAVDLVAIDSVAALTPRAEIEGEMGDTHVGLQARLMSQALRKLAGTLHKSKTCAIFINQLREKIGIMFGSPETTPGGRALKFYSSVRLDVRRIESLKDGTDVVGNRVRVKVVKNKCLAAGTQIFDPTTGLTHAVEDIVDAGAGTAVWAADKNGQLQVRPIVARLNQGQQQVIELAVRGGGNLRVTQDHPVLTEIGWQKAGDLVVGDRIARPRRAGSFGTAEPVPADHARMLGYLIGDGYVGGKTPIAFINTEESLHEDAAAIAEGLGCKTRRTHEGLSANFSHRPGEKNGLLELCRWAGIYGHLAPQKRIPQPFFAEDVAENVVGNLLFGIFESDGWISREQTGAIRCGFTTTSEQLARQIHWLLLRWGIASVVSVHAPGGRRSVIDGRTVVGKLPCWETRISGIDNVRRFSEALPMWGPRGQKLLEALADPTLAKHRGGQTVYLPKTVTEPVIHHLEQLGLSPAAVAAVVGETAGNPQGGFRQVLGSPRLRRDRVQRLADALDSTFLAELLDEDIYYAAITHIGEPEWADTYDVEVEELHNLVANDMVVHNCAAPFKQAEFDIMYGEGISKEGSLIDVGVEEGIVKKAGAWYTYDGEQLGQGRENAKKFLKEHVDTADEIYKKVTEKLGLIPTDVTGADTPDEGWLEDDE
jgi:recombination protein RecA